MDRRALLDVKNNDGASIRFMLTRIKVNYDMKHTMIRKSNFIKSNSMKNTGLSIEEVHKIQELIERIKNCDNSLLNKYFDKSRSLETFTSLSHIRARRIYNHSSSLAWEYLKDIECLLQMENDALKMEEMKMKIEYTADKMKGRGARWDI